MVFNKLSIQHPILLVQYDIKNKHLFIVLHGLLFLSTYTIFDATDSENIMFS